MTLAGVAEGSALILSLRLPAFYVFLIHGSFALVVGGEIDTSESIKRI